MPSLVELTAVVLCGGKGTRLSPVVSDQPKVLAKVNSTPYIYFLLDQIAEAGIKKVVLCTGYMGKLVESTVGKKYSSLEIVYSLETTPMGTGGALRYSVEHIRTNFAIVMNGDSFAECKFDDLFTSNQEWVRPVIGSLAQQMRQAYTDKFTRDQKKMQNAELKRELESDKYYESLEELLCLQ